MKNIRLPDQTHKLSAMTLDKTQRLPIIQDKQLNIILIGIICFCLSFFITTIAQFVFHF